MEPTNSHQIFHCRIGVGCNSPVPMQIFTEPLSTCQLTNYKMKDIHTCLMHDFLTHLRRCSYGSIKLWIPLSHHRQFFCVSNFTNFFDFCNFSSLHSQRGHKLNKYDWIDVYQNVAKSETKSD